jgi:hypothetical protein
VEEYWDELNTGGNGRRTEGDGRKGIWEVKEEMRGEGEEGNKIRV